MAAGAVVLLTAVVNAVQLMAQSPLGPGPSELAYLASFTAVVVAAWLLLADRSLSGPARWALALPAACNVLLLVSFFVLPVSWVRPDVLAAAISVRAVRLSQRAETCALGTSDAASLACRNQGAMPAGNASPDGCSHDPGRALPWGGGGVPFGFSGGAFACGAG